MNVLARIALAAVLVIAVGIGAYAVVGSSGNTTKSAAGPPAESMEGLPQDPRLLNPDVRPAKTGPHPKLQVEQAVYDFGLVALGKSDSHTFEVKNIGDAPLKLGEPIATCKCTATDAGKDRLIAPGESTQITLTYTPQKVANEFMQRAFIHTNDPDDPRLELKVTGAVDDLIKLYPSGMIDFGTVNGKESVTKSIKVVSRFKDEIVLKDVATTSEYFKVTSEPLDLSQPLKPAMPIAETELPDVDGTAPDTAEPPVPPTLEEEGYKSGLELTVELTPGMTVGRFRGFVAAIAAHEGAHWNVWCRLDL
ncbi:MAG: DUF1573 domain-containing protein, partial [Planctomycetota bacterium]